MNEFIRSVKFLYSINLGKKILNKGFLDYIL